MTTVKRYKGMVCTADKVDFRQLTVRYTEDHLGKMISIFDDKTGIMLTVPADDFIIEMTADRRTN